MKERYDYIDSIKGLAIMLVVMGHFLLWNMGAPQDISQTNTTQLFKWIYSFHMPVFMFCSGFLFPKAYSYYKESGIKQIIGKRFRALIIPCVFAGAIAWIAYNEYYWFLVTLFEFCAIYLIVNKIGGGICRWQKKYDLVVNILIAIVLYALAPIFQRVEHYPLLDLGHLSLYIYFCMGVFIRRYELVGKLQKDWIYSVALFVITLLSVLILMSKPLFHLGFLLPVAIVVALLNIFQETKNDRISERLRFYGKHSMEIYILQYFFHIKLPVFATSATVMSEANSLGGLLIFQVLVSLIATVAICEACIAVASIINRSKILSKLLLGKI